MSELEQKIRSLSLRTPNQSLDHRILAALQQSDVTEPTEQSAVKKSVSNDAADFSPTMHANRRGTVITSGWIVASVSMLIGAVVGNALPPVSSLQTQRNTSMNTNQTSEIAGVGHKESTDGTVEPRVSEEGNSTVTGNVRVSPGSVASQIVESIWISPTAAAVAWEQQTGQIFNVVNHVSDRRFDMCRECHRVGG
ncbi:MAG: hypothetical protein U0936_09185 [Planctomycetaceae bacterium]